MKQMLNNKNYFSQGRQRKYKGASQFKSFRNCEAAALAELEGQYTKAPSTAMLVGSYVDAYFSGELDEYKAVHPELFKRDGSLKSDFIQAEQVVKRLEKDKLYMLLMSGKKQVIYTGKIAGVPYKIKIDSLLSRKTCEEIVNLFPETEPVLGFCDGAIVDQKIMRDLNDVWSEEEGCKVPFIRAWGYDIQGAIYQAIQGDMLPFLIAAGTKEDPPDLEAFYIPDEELSACLREVEEHSKRYAAIKKHKIEPNACGICPYCRSQKKLTKIFDFRGASYD